MQYRFPGFVLCFLFVTGVGWAGYTPPDWGTPTQGIELAYNAGQTAAVNGAALEAAVMALTAGQRLRIHAGDYFIGTHFDPAFAGTDGAPIIMEAFGDGEVVIRTDANHNIFDPSGSYAIIRGLTFTQGSAAIRLHDADHIWIDNCHINHIDAVGITANFVGETYSQIHITNNEIHDTSDTGEGLYLGGNNASAILHSSFIVGNHIYNLNGPGVTQGDGIEIKQGSWGNLVADNLVHDCNYPCILLYGTGGNPQNIVERNICYNSGDNVAQIQGEAIVRNNLFINGAAAAFYSRNHQGTVTNLQVYSNTFVNTGIAAVLYNWSGKPNMLFANNACYSQSANAIWLASTPEAGLVFAGNVAVGGISGITSGYTMGGTLATDFVNVSYSATNRDATPAAGSVLRTAAYAPYLPTDDLTGATRSANHVVGAIDPDAVTASEGEGEGEGENIPAIPATNVVGLLILAGACAIGGSILLFKRKDKPKD